MTPEGKVKAKVVKLLKEFRVYYFYPVTGGFGRSGVPDVICCVAGYFFGIECKAGKGKTTMLQELNLKKIIEAGGVALVIREDDIKYLPSLLTTGESNHEENISS